MAQQKFFERWVQNLMESMDAHLDEQTRTALMESRGRACARGDAINSARKCQGNVDRLVTTLEKWIGKGHARRDGNMAHVVYPQ
jgi:hypothetical protein